MNIVKESSVIKEKVYYEKEYLLILWNDEVNSQDFIVLSLSEILKLDFDDAWIIMKRANDFGNTLAYAGSLDDVIEKHNKFSDCKITTSIEKI
jgi:ATP-dependent Clp protease adapter protein ClpS